MPYGIRNSETQNRESGYRDFSWCGIFPLDHLIMVRQVGFLPTTMGTWILPKQLHTSASAPDTGASTLDSIGLSEACELLLMRRSMRSRSRCYLREWKAGRLMRLRSGLMYGISRGIFFTAAWISSVRAIRANPSAMPDSARGGMTSGISGPTSGEGSSQFDLQLSFSKTSRVISRWDSRASSAIWMSWVTAVRGEYSARRNAVRRIAGTECSSLLPTPCANEDSFRLNGSSQQSKTLEAMARRGELRTAATGNVSSVDCLSLEGANAIMVNLNVTTAASGHIHSTITQATDVPIVERVGQSGGRQQAGPLNPSFVETMMGLPIGWTDCDSSETGLSQQPPL